MYHTTGLYRDEVVRLCAAIHESTPLEKRTWPPILGLFRSVLVTLTYLRRNHVQAELAEYHDVSQSTISRAIASITPLLSETLRHVVPTADELTAGSQYIVDGTLLPCWSWGAHPELYSGKHKTTGMSVQLACTLTGAIAWISDPVDGSRHDAYCLTESGALLTLDPQDWIGDKGYVGRDMITPIKKPPGRDLLDWEKKFNENVNRVRSKIERVIAHFKTWRILHTDYRRPIETFESTIAAVVALHFHTYS